MICQMGNTAVSLSEQDVWIAIEDFLNKEMYGVAQIKVTDMKIHRQGSIKAITVEATKRQK